MRLWDVAKLLDAEVLADSAGPRDERLELTVFSACGSDLMSDVLDFMKDQALLLTGQTNPQVIRTAEMAGMKCIVFVRGKRPDDDLARMAAERGLVLMSTDRRMFEACGILYQSGLRGLVE